VQEVTNSIERECYGLTNSTMNERSIIINECYEQKSFHHHFTVTVSNPFFFHPIFVVIQMRKPCRLEYSKVFCKGCQRCWNIPDFLWKYITPLLQRWKPERLLERTFLLPWKRKFNNKLKFDQTSFLFWRSSSRWSLLLLWFFCWRVTFEVASQFEFGNLNL